MIRHWVPILPEHIWSKIPAKDVGKKYQNNPPYVGSGPFKCVEWKKNNYVHLVANPTWWGPKPKIDEIYFTYYTNGDTMLQDIKAGTIDGACNLVPAAGQAAPERTRHHRPRHRHRRLRRAGLQLLRGAQQGPPGAEGRRSSGRR